MSYTESQPQLKCLYGRKSEKENWKDKVKGEADAGWYTHVFPKRDIIDNFKDNWHFFVSCEAVSHLYVCMCTCARVFYMQRPSHVHYTWNREEHFFKYM